MSQDPVIVELVRRVTNLEDDMMRQSARISVPVAGAFFSANAAGTTNVPSGTFAYTTTIALANIIYTDGHFAANAYTCPVAGHYLFCGTAYMTATAANLCQIGVLKNGAQAGDGVGAIVTPAGAPFFPTVAVVLPCVPGDVITFGARADGAGVVHAATFVGQIQ